VISVYELNWGINMEIGKQVTEKPIGHLRRVLRSALVNNLKYQLWTPIRELTFEAVNKVVRTPIGSKRYKRINGIKRRDEIR
jgi:hypothetical protein